MTLEQREMPMEVKNRVKLDLGVLKSKMHIEQNTNKGSNSKTNSTPENDFEFISVLGYVEEMTYSFFESYEEYGFTKKKYEKFVIDSIIDRLSQKNFVKMVSEIASMYNNDKLVGDIPKSCMRSLVEGDILIILDNNKLQYFYNHYDVFQIHTIVHNLLERLIQV
jgi:hypothetical protein